EHLAHGALAVRLLDGRSGAVVDRVPDARPQLVGHIGALGGGQVPGDEVDVALHQVVGGPGRGGRTCGHRELPSRAVRTRWSRAAHSWARAARTSRPAAVRT